MLFTSADLDSVHHAQVSLCPALVHLALMHVSGAAPCAAVAAQPLRRFLLGASLSDRNRPTFSSPVFGEVVISPRPAS